MLAANEAAVYFGWAGGIVAMSGTFQPHFDPDGNFVGRDYQADVLTQGTAGVISPDFAVADQDIYCIGDDGPKVLTRNSFFALTPEAIRPEWDKRTSKYHRRWRVGYLPEFRLVLFAYTTDSRGITGLPDTVLAWHIDKQRWCPPWDLHVTSLTLHRYLTSGGDARGHRLFAGGPYGSVKILGWGDGDGWDGSDADHELTATSQTTTSVDVSGKSWTVDEFADFGLVLQHPTTGEKHSRTVSTNDADTLTWAGAITAPAAGNWKVWLGGINRRDHSALFVEGQEIVVEGILSLFLDPPSVRT
jgi:hypothetical protein